MQILFGKTKWEVPELSLDDYMAKTKADGFDVAELYVPTLAESADVVRRMANDHGLQVIADIATEGSTVEEHLDCLDRYAVFAHECGAILINSHTGKDYFPFTDNVRLLQRGIELGRDARVPFAHETHRSRALYSAVDTRHYLDELPDLRINADFSHWMNVHESDLRDQMHNVLPAIERAVHIHARVGYEEGPQVNDPRAPEWAGHLANHVDLWKQIVQAREEAGDSVFTVTPEFGPVPYMPTAPYTEEPLADTWEVNVFMRDYLWEILGRQ